MSKVCCVCGNDLGYFSSKINLKDGYLCSKCLKKGKISGFPDSAKYDVAKIVNIMTKRKEALTKYRPTKRFGRIEIDTNNKAFTIDDDFFLFENLVSYAFHEYPDNTRLAQKDGKSGGAVIGGVIGGLGGGLIGSAVGAAVGKKVGSLFSSVCERMYISITLKDSPLTDVRLTFINEKTRVTSSTYTDALMKANEIIDALKIIDDDNRNEKNSSTFGNVNMQTINNNIVMEKEQHIDASRIAEEIKVYRTLMEQGILTEEEYERKKQQLLSMN